MFWGRQIDSSVPCCRPPSAHCGKVSGLVLRVRNTPPFMQVFGPVIFGLVPPRQQPPRQRHSSMPIASSSMPSSPSSLSIVLLSPIVVLFVVAAVDDLYLEKVHYYCPEILVHGITREVISHYLNARTLVARSLVARCSTSSSFSS